MTAALHLTTEHAANPYKAMESRKRTKARKQSIINHMLHTIWTWMDLDMDVEHEFIAYYLPSVQLMISRTPMSCLHNQ